MAGLISSFGNAGLGPVEVARAVGAGRHAAAAADAPVVVDHHDPVRLGPGGAGRTGLDARGVAALLAGDRHVEMALLRDLGRVVVGVGVAEVDALLLLHLQHADPVQLRVARLVVLLDAGVDAAPAADAAGQVERVGEEHAGQRRRVGHLHRHAALRGVLALHLVERLAQALLRHLAQAPGAAPRQQEAGGGGAGDRGELPARAGARARAVASRFFTGRCFMAQFPGGRGGSGAGFGCSAWKRGACGLWQ